MAISVVMPALEMAQETGKLLAWKKKEGEQVTKGEPLFEIETDKAVVEIVAPGDGVLAGILAGVGAEIPVGQTIAWLVKAGEQTPSADSSPNLSGRASTTRDTSSAVTAAPQAQPSQISPQISPKARRLAKELGVDTSGLHGTGLDGTITAEDVQTAANAKSSVDSSQGYSPAPATPLSQIARIMAEKTAQSWTTVPHFFLTRDVVCNKLIEKQKQLAPLVEKVEGLKLTITDLLVRLTAKILEKHRKINASWTGNNICLNPEINISLAIAVQDGVVGAVIHKANELTLPELSTQRRDLAERARTNQLRPADISGGTFTISNLGMFQVDAFMAIITPPQAAILAVGAIGDRVIALDGKPAVLPVMTITLSADHRVADGARAAEFLRDLAEAISEPSRWLD